MFLSFPDVASGFVKSRYAVTPISSMARKRHANSVWHFDFNTLDKPPNTNKDETKAKKSLKMLFKILISWLLYLLPCVYVFAKM